VSLQYLEDSGRFDKVPAQGLTKTIRPGEGIRVFVEGQDPRGVLRVTLTQASEVECSAGKLREERREDAVHTETNEVNPGEVGTTELYLSSVVRADVDCDHGLAPRSHKVTVYGSAENYHGGVSTTPTLVVDVDLTPKPPPR
jgi:hypothetical protein